MNIKFVTHDELRELGEIIRRAYLMEVRMMERFLADGDHFPPQIKEFLTTSKRSKMMVVSHIEKTYDIGTKKRVKVRLKKR